MSTLVRPVSRTVRTQIFNIKTVWSGVEDLGPWEWLPESSSSQNGLRLISLPRTPYIFASNFDCECLDVADKILSAAKRNILWK